MPESDESGFTFVDKRRTTQDPGPSQPSDSPSSATSDTDPAASASTEPESGPSASPPGTTSAADHLGAMPRLNVRDRLLMCIDILNQGAWISLGLLSDPATGQIEQDLVQAKTAIDGVAFLADKIEAELDDETRRELRNLVRDLQLNFVQQSSR